MAVVMVVPMRLRPLLLMARMLMVSCMVLNGDGGGGKGRLSGLQVFFAPPDNGGNNLVAKGLPQGRRQAVATAHADAAIFALVQGCHGREHEHVASLSFADETGDHGDELVFDKGGGHG